MQPGASADASQVPEQGLSIAEAAAQLGVSANTVRARIRRGELRAEQAHRPQGIVWRVYLDQPPTNGQAQPGTSAGISQVPAAWYQAEAMARVLEPLIEAAAVPLRAELADTRTALETARQEVGQLRAELQQAQERLLALEAPRQEPDTSLGFTSGPADGLGAEPAQEPPETDHAPRRPWWRFW